MNSVEKGEVGGALVRPPRPRGLAATAAPFDSTAGSGAFPFWPVGASAPGGLRCGALTLCKRPGFGL